ncbi:DUF4349 domain-containing protein [Streptomyces sp. NPDC006610]|uniref:DUF4349 domain-containing protein n=1 Tax=Streptomyces sp. NPDC006610 TaxID=3154584 RepID=UPI0033B9A049
MSAPCPAPRATRLPARRPLAALAGILLAAALALTGCSGADDIGGGGTAADGKAEKGALQEGAAGSGAADRASAAPRPPAQVQVQVQGHIIRTASLSVLVEDVPKALDEARATVEGAGGHVGSESTSRDENGNEYTRVVLRVPTERYDDVLADLEGAGRLLERTAKAQDVTDQVVDVESRIRTQRASVARIRELMDQAVKLSDVVELEGQLSSRQADLEALLARQASLKDRTSLATIRLSLSETPVEKAAEDGDPGLGDALAGGWDAFVGMLRWILVAVAAVLPFAALAALLLFVWLRVLRSRGTGRPAAGEAMTALGPLPAARPAPTPAPAEGTGEED